MTPTVAALTKGEELFTREVALTRAHLIDYAAASGDHNPIHWNDVVAEQVGLPGVIAHGMLTMGLAGSAVSDWAGDAGAVTGVEARFTRPIVVPNPGSATLTITGTVGALRETEQGGEVRVDLKVTGPDGSGVLAKSRATVNLPR